VVVAAAPAAPAAKADPRVGPISWKQVIGVKTGERPLLVWITDGTDTTVERRTFDDASVRLASRAFRTVRIRPAAAQADPVLAPFARSTPTFVVFTPNLARGAAISGPSLDARTALDAMRKSARTDLGLDLDAALTKARALMAEEESVAGQKSDVLRAASYDAARATELDRRLATIRADLTAVFRPPLPRPAP
jgi:hypothetical protein